MTEITISEIFSKWFLLRISLNLMKGFPRTGLIMLSPLELGCRCTGKVSVLMILVSSSPVALKTSLSSCSSSTLFVFSSCASSSSLLTTSIFFPCYSSTSFIFPLLPPLFLFLHILFEKFLVLLEKKKLLQMQDLLKEWYFHSSS